MRPKPFSLEKQVLDLRANGLSYSDVGDRLNLTRNQVAGIVYRAGETKDYLKGSCRRIEPDFKNQVAKAEGTQADVAKRWGVSASSVSEWRRGLGVSSAKSVR